ncbi:MAG: hypothetical protein EXR71_17175 [Myxococcales bacterium]|nr:hypothetical protein [Myxococcales bacterium]
MLFTVLSLALSSCTGDEPVNVVAPPTAVPPVAPKTGIEGARATFATGDAAGALKLAEGWLTSHPEDDAGWDLVELLAQRAGDLGGMVDRLSADQAIGGRTDRHHALRGALALGANRPADALVAARALAAVSPGDAAALVAGAVALGAPAPEGLDPTAALLVAAWSDPKTAIDPAVDALAGWRVALVRAKIKAGRGDVAGVNAELARLPAGLARLQGLPLALGAAPDATTAWAAAEATARDAMAGGDVVGAAQSLDLGLPAALSAWEGGRVAAAAAELRKKAEEAANAEGGAALAAVEAHGNLRAGKPILARDAARIAAAGAGSKARGSWELALACASLGDAPCIDGALAGLVEPEATAGRELAAALRGGAVVPGAGLDPDRAALVALLASGWVDDPAVAWERAASASSPDLRLWGAALANRGALPGSGGAGFTEEAAARRYLSTGGGAALVGDHPDTAAWNAAINAEAGAPGSGLTGWARARAALQAGDVATAARDFGVMAIAVPSWRTGPWTPVLVLDGPTPEQLGADAERVRIALDSVTPAIELHGWSHRHETSTLLWQSGVSAVPGKATPEQSAAVWDAAAAYRVASLAWLAGSAPFPVAARAALTAAESSASLTRFQSPSATALRGALDGAAVLSFRRLPGMVEVLYVTADGGKLVKLKPQTAETMATWTREVVGGDNAVAAGDRLRTAVLDSAHDVLVGTGKFVVVGPPPFGTFAIDALPEQSDGLRFLADIRSVARMPDFDALVAVPPPEPEEYQQTLVALCATPSEAEMIRRLYPQAMVLEGLAATAAAWKANAGSARFIHIGDFPTGPSGGWQVADGELTLDDVVRTSLMARNGYVGGGSDASIAQARIAALRRAGLIEMLVGAPTLDPMFHDRTVLHFWEGVNRRYSATRSYYDSRASTLREFDAANRPVNWIRYLISGKP